MSPLLIDTHCHLDHPPLADEWHAALTRARAAGVTRCVTVGTSLASSRANVAIAREVSSVRAVVGVHPHEADTVTEAILAELEQLADDPSVAAIGEVGLDYYRMNSTAEDQQRALRQFLELARRTKLPLVIHCRDAYTELLELLNHDGTRPLRGVMHCASGPEAFIREALQMGFTISFAGNVTFAKAVDLQRLVPLVPDDRLVIETDAPFLTPEPLRGQRNEPANLTHTAAFVAALRGVSVETLGELTSRNARALFGFPGEE